MRTTRSRSPLPPLPQQPQPVIHRNRQGDRHPSRSEARSKPTSSNNPSKRKPIPRKPVPVRSKESKARSPSPAIRRIKLSDPTTGMYSTESFQAIPEHTVLEHGTNQPIDLSDLVENDDTEYYSYDPVPRGRALSRSPQQPIPLRSRQVRKDPRHQPSDSSLVKRITKMAETMEFTGYPNLERRDMPSVPKLTKAPKVPAWRKDTPHPAASSKGKHARSQSALPISHMKEASSLRTAPATYVVRARASTDSLPGGMTQTGPRSRENSYLPPPRTAELRSFREQGIPSAAFLREEINGEKIQTVHSGTAMLVSISTPSPSYSCAVQSCYCTPEDEDDQVCPSCRERRRLERELQMKWI
ncbi:hypothetical protein F4804DRAFT_315755 [Jackrogersella minutella]|nr:hypothetical protein F4804DRAFT_315755 [Jackrogersella minutella]